MNLPNVTQLALVEQLTTLNEQLDLFINGDAGTTVATRAGTLKTLSGIVDDLSKFKYVQKIVNHRLYRDMIADDIEEGLLVRVWGDIEGTNGIFKKMEDGDFVKVSYSDLFDIAEPPVDGGGNGGGEPPNGLNNIIQKVAGITLSGHRAVLLNANNKAIYASNDLPALGLRVLGITTGSAIVGTEVDIQTSGELVEPSWNWDTTKPIYLGISGYLTQVPPTSGVLIIMGIPSNTNSMIINVRDPIVLS